MKRFFLGMAAEYGASRRTARHTFCHGRARDIEELKKYLGERYSGEAITCKNGRSGLALALRAFFKRGEKVLVNGFTCYAVYEGIQAAGLIPVFVDISQEDLNFDYQALEKAAKESQASGIIIQNSLGNPVDIGRIESLAKKYHLTIIEDLAHSAGVKYEDGREAGTVGAAVAFSFGKDKSVDTVNGGAVVFREETKQKVGMPHERARASDTLRARFYPMLAGLCRGLTAIHLGGILMRLLVKIHWVEKSADNHLDTTRQISRFEARLALEQFRGFREAGERPIREFVLVREREKVLEMLKKAGYYFDSIWYKKPVAPERYYKKVHFNEAECPSSVYTAEHIINLPTYYSRGDLKRARKIIKPYIINEGKNGKVE